MNYFHPAFWTHPESEEVCKRVLSDAVQGAFSECYKGENSHTNYHYFSWERPDAFGLDLTIYESKGNLTYLKHSLWGSSDIEHKDGQIYNHEEIYFSFGLDDSGKTFAHQSESYVSQRNYPLPIAARFFYWLGVDLENITLDNPSMPKHIRYLQDFPQTQHEKLELELERRDSWKKMWHLRPDCLR